MAGTIRQHVHRHRFDRFGKHGGLVCECGQRAPAAMARTTTLAARTLKDDRFKHVPTVTHEAWAALNSQGELIRGEPDSGYENREVVTFGSADDALWNVGAERACRVKVTVQPIEVSRAKRRRRT